MVSTRPATKGGLCIASEGPPKGGPLVIASERPPKGGLLVVTSKGHPKGWPSSNSCRKGFAFARPQASLAC